MDTAERAGLPSGLRRGLARAEGGKTLTAAEAAWLLDARGPALARLMGVAARIRDQAFGERVTYSRKVFVPLTHLCRDRCGYCTFAQPPPRDRPPYLSIDEVLAVARAGAEAGCKEALFTLGDRPEERYPVAREWLESHGYSTTLEYLRAAAIAVIEGTGLVPHLNPGLMSWTELSSLKQVSGSMGIMLESASERLHERGGAHHRCDTKLPERRLRVIEDAGRLSIPFTSGILVGIGETALERAEALLALAGTARRYGHLQEVIVQNFRAKPRTAMRSHAEPDRETMLATVAVARILLPKTVHVQAPPNLSPGWQADLVAAGIDDWGGVSPVTPDHVNPEYAWPGLDALAGVTAAAGKRLVERLCAYPAYVRKPDPWLAGKMQPVVAALADGEGYAVAGSRPSPIPWQDPDRGAEPSAQGDDQRWHAGSVAGQGVTAHQRGAGVLRPDASDVYGDTGLIAAGTLSRGPGPRSAGTASARVGREVAGILRRAERGTPPGEREAVLLLEADGAELDALVATADAVRAARVGERVTYVVNRNINFTNICYTGCRFCAFAQRRDDPDAYTLSLEQVADRVEEAWGYGATEVCLQGGIHPDLDGDYYFRILDAIKARVPDVHVHAFSPMEVVNGAARLGVGIREWLVEARHRGLGSIPGTAAEILDDDVRWLLTKGKLPTDAWIEVVTTAHDIGLPSSSTMMYGHVDTPAHWAAHLHLLRALQDRTGGFTEFVALPFVHTQAPIYLAGHARPGPTWEDNLRVHAVARLVLQGAIDHIQLSWVKLGLELSAPLLHAGCDDLGGTLMEETISRMAGADHGTRQTPEALRAAIVAAGRTPAERTTTYDRVESDGIRYRLAAAT
jgi:FO synthase